MKKITFSGWLLQAFALANKKPVLWLGWVLAFAVLLGLGRISLLLAIVASVTSLFLGIGLVTAIDRDESVDMRAVGKRHLPTALTLALIIALCWFVFRVAANIHAGESEKILQFFFHWELTPENLSGKTLRELIVWLYSAGIVALLFVLLMLGSFGSWFSYPLMVFEHHSWSEARERGRQAFNQHTSVMYKLGAFVMLSALVGMGLVPLLTPLFYMLVATLMYVSYRDIFVHAH
ncbi:hypothetical protein [Methylomarinum vadi]|uniref:hypothetical protein n=1 Tax=Methylomarinum vadi TaxID=438855 RepID=UPI0004DF2B33|nr:hypothetical protein [Methylomarinum vadi]